MESEVATDYRRSYAALKGMSHRYADPGLAVLIDHRFGPGPREAGDQHPEGPGRTMGVLKRPDCSGVRISADHGLCRSRISQGEVAASRQSMTMRCAMQTRIAATPATFVPRSRRYSRALLPTPIPCAVGRNDPAAAAAGTRRTLAALPQTPAGECRSFNGKSTPGRNTIGWPPVAGEIARILAATRLAGGN